MMQLLQRLLILLTTGKDQEPAQIIQFLLVENQILRSKLPKRISLNPADRRRLLKYGKPLGKAIREFITIVSPRTFLRWLNAEISPVRKCSEPKRQNSLQRDSSAWLQTGCGDTKEISAGVIGNGEAGCHWPF
jgi:hypothetical protein